MGFWGDVGGYALPVGGAVAGGLIGGPAGAAVGAGLGGSLAASMGHGQRTGGQWEAVDPNLGLDGGLLQRQMNQMDRLNNRALGNGPSMAVTSVAQARDRGIAQLQSQARSVRGSNQAFAQRQAMIQGGVLSARLAREQTMGKLQEQQQSEAALAQAIQAARQADMQRAQVYEQARTQRYMAQMGQPTNFERGAAVLGSTLPYALQFGQQPQVDQTGLPGYYVNGQRRG